MGSIQFLGTSSHEEIQTMSQRSEILSYMKKGYYITTYMAFMKFKCTSLRDRIRDIEHQGIKVKRQWVKSDKKRYLEYWI